MCVSLRLYAEYWSAWCMALQVTHMYRQHDAYELRCTALHANSVLLCMQTQKCLTHYTVLQATTRKDDNKSRFTIQIKDYAAVELLKGEQL